MTIARWVGMLGQVGRCCREGLSAPTLLTWAHGRRCRRPRCSRRPTAFPVGVRGPARRGPAPLGPARPRSAPLFLQTRMRRRRRRASPARAAAVLARPRDPFPPASLAASASCSAGPRAVTHPATACDTQVHLQGPEVASHRHTLSWGHTLPHCHRHRVTYSVTNINLHSHTHTVSPPHMWSHRIKHSNSHTLTQGPTLAQCPVASCIVTH